ncbi:MAG: LCP family protein [Bacilli bacterium]|nr:LCP family protein [Bacilli bacterium]
MKVFFNKLKKSNKVFLALYLVSLLFYLISYIIFTINILHLSSIETPIRIVVLIIFGIWLIFWFLKGLVNLFTKKYKSMIILIVFTCLFATIFDFASYYIGTIYSGISSISKDKLVYTSNLVTLKNSEFNSSSKIGMINDSNDVEGYILGNKLIKQHSLSNEIERYDDYYQMLSDLYSKQIGAVVVSGNYALRFSSEEQFEKIGKETKVIYEYSEEMNNVDNVSYTNKKLTEPFSILLMGVDSNKDGLNANQAFNGDTLMLITFNPKTLTASVFSVPRDTYVPIACRNNAWAKINSSAASGTNCVIQTISSLTGITVDFYVKINFKGVVDLVNALGGVTVDVEKPYFNFNNGVDYHGQVCEQNSDRKFGKNMVCLDPGKQKLNGEQALAYSRNRHQYIGSDLDRVKHQQQVVAAIANEVKSITSFEQFESILNAIQKNMDTNMKSDQILSIYDVAKKIVMNSLSGSGEPVSINRTVLETYSLPVWTGRAMTSALGYYKDSLDEIVKMMKVNLEVESATLNKNYDIDYNENYTSRLYGEKLRTTRVQYLMANLEGKTKEAAIEWCKENNLSYSIKYVDEGDTYFNNNVNAGYVAAQSVREKSLINNISEVTLYINNTSPTRYQEPTVENNQSTTDEEVQDENENENQTPTTNDSNLSEDE